MEKIKLTKRGQELFRAILNDTFTQEGTIADQKELLILEKEGLITLRYNSFGIKGNVTRFGAAYSQFNPTLKNPSIWDDTKYVINTIIALLALIASFVSILLHILN